jgi:putative ABC transport system permease protein
VKLFCRLILRPLRRDRARTILSILSIALGVAVVIAIELSGEAATGSFESSLTTLLGKVDYDITANGGVDEKYIGKLAMLPVNAHWGPVIEQPVVIAGQRIYTTLYGIDAISSARQQDFNGEARDFDPEAAESAAVVSSDLASRLHWTRNGTIQLRGRSHTLSFTIRQIVPGRNTEWIAVDIAAAQSLFDMYGTLDRIEVVLSPNQDVRSAEHLIRGVLPSAWNMETPGMRSEENRRMLRAFRWNLRILSYISLLVGAFLIYNTIAVSVVRRRTEIGILRALGISSRGVLMIFLGEAIMLGVAGSLAGILLGRVLAAALLRMVSQTINALFITSAPGAIALSLTSIAGAIAAGTIVAFFSALIPAREAARIAPAEAMRRAIVEHRTRMHVRRDLAIAALLGVLAYVLALFRPIGGQPFLGYASTLVAVAAAAMAAPPFVAGGIRALHPALKRIPGAAGLIAGRSLVASLSRTSVVVTALATAISMMVSVGIMVGSFRETVVVWLDSQLRADLYLRAQGGATAGIFPAIAAPVPDLVRATPGVAEVDVYHAFEFHYEGTRANFGAGNIDIFRRRRSLRFLSGNANEILASLPGHDRVVVTEPFADKHHVRPGAVLRIPLGPHTVAFTVAGIYYDYSSDRGIVLADRSTLLKYLPDQPITNIAVYLQPGAGPAAVRRDLESRLAEYPVAIAPNQALRRGAVEVFDRTFAVTYALEAVAIVVAMLGAANSLLALVLDRRREIGLIRYLGAAGGQVRQMILTEAGLLGLLAGLLGVVLGVALSLVLIYVVNKQSFGWTIQFHPPILLLGGALLLVWIVTILAGVYPARFAARLQPAEVIHEE